MEPASLDCTPPLTVWGSIKKHVMSWPELYVALPLGILSLPLAALFVFTLTGHRPQENMDWILDFAGRFKLACFVVVLVSFARQATGIWMTKEEQFAHPYMATLATLTKVFYFLFFAWLLKN